METKIARLGRKRRDGEKKRRNGEKDLHFIPLRLELIIIITIFIIFVVFIIIFLSVIL